MLVPCFSVAQDCSAVWATLGLRPPLAAVNNVNIHIQVTVSVCLHFGGVCT